MKYKLSIIIPTLNESNQIELCLNELQRYRELGHEVIVVDGGSYDNTTTLATALSDRVIHSKKSRAIQMNSGAAVATGDYLVFLHADTFLPKNTVEIISKIEHDVKKWGRFDITLTGRQFIFRVIEWCMNKRSRLTGIATGDQVIFVNRKLFHDVSGFPEIQIMEDIALSKVLLNYSRPIYINEKVTSSSRRWEENGIVKTILKMWLMRFLYYINFDTYKLEKFYS